MVYYNRTAEDDFVEILNGLAIWEKHPLGYDHAMQYVSDIRTSADSICKKFFHQNCVYKQHLNYGTHIHIYKRNAYTQWYIIYNWDAVNRIAYVLKILNNYLTYSIE
jgi:hypothetical protein